MTETWPAPLVMEPGDPTRLLPVLTGPVVLPGPCTECGGTDWTTPRGDFRHAGWALVHGKPYHFDCEQRAATAGAFKAIRGRVVGEGALRLQSRPAKEQQRRGVGL